MKIPYQDFDPRSFSFREHPVLVLQNFWSEEEMAGFRRAMRESTWTRLSQMPDVRRTFSRCGDWLKAELADAERNLFVSRVMMPCIEDYMQSFERVRGGVMSFNYYEYGAGDCLSMHTDTDSGDVRDQRRATVRRRIAVTTYVHEAWDPDWGGEFMAYRGTGDDGRSAFELTHCIEPEPGQLTLFTVPRHHRVSRVDPLAGDHKRLSISGWFMTDHWGEHE